MAGDKTAAEAHAKIDTHEKVCAALYAGISKDIAEIKAWMKLIVYGVACLTASLMGFMAHELWSNNQERLARLETTPAAHVAPR